MFEAPGARFGDLLMRGLDCAIEFATLGEYRLGPAPADVATTAPSTSREADRPLARTVMPATPAARKRVEAAARAAARDRACEARGAIERRVRALDGPPRRRTRGGSASPPPQPCLWPSEG
jgi:hypothetical protein